MEHPWFQGAQVCEHSVFKSDLSLISSGKINSLDIFSELILKERFYNQLVWVIGQACGQDSWILSKFFVS